MNLILDAFSYIAKAVAIFIFLALAINDKASGDIRAVCAGLTLLSVSGLLKDLTEDWGKK